jgi:S-adenosyl methyltransferase
MSSGEAESPGYDTSVAHIARVYDYWLGGEDNYPADQAVAEQVMQAYPVGRRSQETVNRAPGRYAARASRWRQRSARATSSRASVSSRRSAAGGLVRSM